MRFGHTERAVVVRSCRTLGPYSMNQSALYATLHEAGCKVLVFEDHPQFFGNWLAHFTCGGRRFEVVSDNREGWLALWERDPKGSGTRLYEVQSHTFDETKELEVLAAWLRELALAQAKEAPNAPS